MRVYTGEHEPSPSDKCKRDLVARVPVADEVFGRGRGWHLLHRINEGVMDRETRKNHPDEVFRIQFDLEEKREGKGKQRIIGAEDFHLHRFLDDWSCLWERDEVVFGGFFFFLFLSFPTLTLMSL